MKLLPLVLLVIAAPLCCAALPLIAGGAFAGFAAWFLEGPGIWLICVPIAAGIAFVVWRRLLALRGGAAPVQREVE